MRMLLLAGLLATHAVSAADLPSVHDFMRHAAYSDALISPDGRYLALSIDRGDQDVLTVLKLADMSIAQVNVLPEEKSVAGIQWISDERLVFTAERKVGSYAAPFRTGEWFAVNADGSQPATFIHYGARSAAERNKAAGTQSFAMLDPLIDGEPREVLMSAYYRRSSDGAGVELVRVDTFSGTRRLIARAPADNCRITLDEKKAPAYAVCSQIDDVGGVDRHTEVYRYGDNREWTLVNRSLESGRDLSILGTSDHGRLYAMEAAGGKPSAFGDIDPATGKFRSLFQDPVADVGGLVVSPTDDSVLAVVTEAGVPRVELVDEEHADTELYASLSQAFAGQFVDFDSATRDGKQIVVSVRSDRNPGELYLYDRATGSARFLMRRRDWVDPDTSATVRAFSFTTRDGLKLHGYLTIPHGSDGKNLPVIVNPHGGPMGPRDYWGYNPETQLFASRGYAVLQVNFRGSGGYGEAFQEMAYGSWATGIMNDVIDATRWAIGQGIADADRICIYGGSFGGYASLMAPAIEPSLFQCAFGYVGMYDAQLQFKLSDTGRSDDGEAYLRRSFGPTRAQQDAMSPITHAAKITLPVMLAAGARDERCPPEHTRAMYAALEKAGNKPEDMIIAPDEMHGFYDVDTRVDLYTKMLAFFDRHIGATAHGEVGEVEPVDGP